MSWGDLFDVLLDAATVGIAGYVAYKGAEAIVDWTDALVQSSEDEAAHAIVTTVPTMDDATWNFFYNYLTEKAYHSGYAHDLLKLSRRVRYS